MAKSEERMRVLGNGIRYLVLATAVLSALTLRAESIGPDCPSCYGAIYSLTNLGLQASDATTETWRIRYEIDTTGYDRGGSWPILTDYISSIAIKVSSSLISVVNFQALSPGNWTTPELNSGLNNNDCSGSGNGWICTETQDKTAVTNGDNYAWIFDVKMKTNSLLSDASIKANYEPHNGILVSETVRLSPRVQVPEPFDLPYLIGAVGFALWLRSRSARQRA
jgi:hypothetical protein